jgi:hypothetical protein
MDNNFYSILQTFKKLNEGSAKKALHDLADRYRDDREGFIDYTTTTLGYNSNEMAEFWDDVNGPLDGQIPSMERESVEQECSTTMSPIEKKLRARWEETKKQKGIGEATYGMTNGAAPGAPVPPADPAAAAQAKSKLQSTLQGIPGIDANKAVTDLTDPKDVSGIDVALANALKDPATAPKAKELLAKGMQTTGTV